MVDEKFFAENFGKADLWCLFLPLLLTLEPQIENKLR
jgi:hypothetical protein